MFGDMMGMMSKLKEAQKKVEENSDEFETTFILRLVLRQCSSMQSNIS